MIALLRSTRLLARMLATRARTERGATAIEYAVVAAGIAAIVVLAVALLGRATNSDFDCTAESWELRDERC